MLWLIRIIDGGDGYMHAATGDLYTMGGARLGGNLSYYATDTNPPQPSWWVEPPPLGPHIDLSLTLEAVQQAIQAKLDAAAQARGFDSIFTAATYVGSVVPKFAADAKALRDWRDLCWATAYTIMGEVLAGTREMPTLADVLAEMPALA